MQFLKGLAALSFFVPVGAYAQTYTYTNVIDSDSPLGNFGRARINNSGQVSFTAARDAGGQGVFRQDGLLTTTIADTTGPYSSFQSETDINASGQVVYTGSSTGGFTGVFRASGGSPTTIADSTGSLGSFDSRVRINDAGTVVFSPTPDGVGAAPQISIGSGSNLSLIAAGGAFGFVSVYAPDINNSDIVSFGQAVVFPGPPPVAGQSVNTSNGATGTSIADTTGPFALFTTEGSPINDAGHVLILGALDTTGVKQLALFNGTSLTPLVATGAGYSDLIENIELNASDAIAFMATLQSAGTGIFDGPDATNDEVVLEGQSLFGSTITPNGLQLGGMNDLGQIVFNYTLADGRTGIAIASPVPEPGLALLMLALPMSARRSGMRARKS